MTWIAVQAVEGTVGERIGEAVEIGQDVGAAGGIAVDSDGAGLLVNPAADVEHPHRFAIACFRHSSSVSKREIALVARDHQRRAQPDCVVARAQHQQAALEGQLDHPVAQLRAPSPWSPGRAPARCRSSAPGRARRPRSGSAPANRACGPSGARPCARRSPPVPSSSSAMVASAAAQATGLPPNVEACAPGGQVIRSARATVAPSGMPLAIPLATARMSGTTSKCSAAHILPVRPMPRLHFVEDQQNAVLLGHARQFVEELSAAARRIRPRPAPVPPRWRRSPRPARWSSAACPRCT